MPPKPVCVLTIAGSDSCGGAGIQADLRAITALGAFASTAITALTAQNTQGVRGAMDVPVDFLRAQIDAVLADIRIDAVKTGMLSSAAIVGTVAERVRHWQMPNLVVDPVMVAQSGDTLIGEDAVTALVGQLFPLATAVTPNLNEARRLTGMTIRTVADMRAAAQRIHAHGSRFVVVKGGHLEAGPAVDVLYDGTTWKEFSGPRFAIDAHGSGCTFAASLATFLGRNLPMPEAVAAAKEFTARAIRDALFPGRGSAVINPQPNAECRMPNAE